MKTGLNVTITIYCSPEDLIDKMEQVFNTYDKSKYVYSEFDEEVCKSGDAITAMLCEVNSYAKSVPKSFKNEGIRNFLLYIKVYHFTGSFSTSRSSQFVSSVRWHFSHFSL